MTGIKRDRNRVRWPVLSLPAREFTSTCRRISNQIGSICYSFYQYLTWALQQTLKKFHKIEFEKKNNAVQDLPRRCGQAPEDGCLLGLTKIPRGRVLSNLREENRRAHTSVEGANFSNAMGAAGCNVKKEVAM